MRTPQLALLILSLSITSVRGQEALTTDQRKQDVAQLAAMYAKQYGPYEWKRDTIGFDLYRLTPWLQRVQHTDDLDFQEVLIDYVASLNDAHASVSFPSTFSASLGFTVDIFDGAVLVDSVNRAQLPATQYPFEVGDELVAFDGEPVASVIASLRKYIVSANQRSTDRGAAHFIATRFQQIMPHAPSLGDAAVVSIRLAATGAVHTYVIPWLKTGIGVESQGPVPSPRRGNGRIFLSTDAESPLVPGIGPSLFGIAETAPIDNTLPAYMEPIRPLLNASAAKFRAIRGLGARAPIYAPPPGFVQRLGTQPSHFFFSGTFVANGVSIGLLRIPSMQPPNTALALQQLDQEVAFFNANTDVLIVDVMRNLGGFVQISEAFAQRLIPVPFQTVGFEIRATANWVASFASRLTLAQQSGAPPEIVQNLRNNFEEVLSAYNEERGRSAPVSLNATGSLTLAPAAGAYTKPLMVLVDEFSASSADMFAAIIQDNHRGTIFGMRTMGAGGSVVSNFDCATFTESLCSITVSLMNRGTIVSTPDFPPAPYIENIGVRPDVVVDYMTRANLMGAGAPFVQAFTQAAVTLAQIP